MTYLSDLHTYLHQSSLLIQAYPTSRITTKYSLPRKTSRPNTTATTMTEPKENAQGQSQGKEKREPSATLTLKTFHAESGICLKYRTDKAQEIGRLMTGLGRLAKGEIIEMPPSSSTATTIPTTGDKMDVDEVASSSAAATEDVKTSTPHGQGQGGASATGGGAKKKKKGKK